MQTPLIAQEMSQTSDDSIFADAPPIPTFIQVTF